MPPPAPRHLRIAFAAALCLLAGGALAQTKPGTSTTARGSIYTCVDGSGQPHTSDRPIPACFDREQVERNADGSLKRVLPPSMSPEQLYERQEAERARQLKEQEARQRQRADRLLLSRYPDEASHDRAREAALEAPRATIRVAGQRLTELQAERTRLDREAEFYKGRTMPPALRQEYEANDSATQVQRAAIVNQQAEIDRVNALFDAERKRLRELRSSTAR